MDRVAKVLECHTVKDKTVVEQHLNLNLMPMLLCQAASRFINTSLEKLGHQASRTPHRPRKIWRKEVKTLCQFPEMYSYEAVRVSEFKGNTSLERTFSQRWERTASRCEPCTEGGD